MPLDGQKCLVTGAAAGIGRAVAQAAASVGVVVYALDVDAPGLADTAALAPQSDGKIVPIECDVSDTKSVDAALAEFRSISGDAPVDFVINCAGVEGPVGLMTESSINDFDRVMAVNVRGAFLVLHGLLPDMVSAGNGAVVNIVSVGGLLGVPGMSPYVTSKHALLGLTRTLAGEVARQGVRVNAICPGSISTGMQDRAEAKSSDPAAFRRAQEAKIPLGRYGTASEVAELALFLVQRPVEVHQRGGDSPRWGYDRYAVLTAGLCLGPRDARWKPPSAPRRGERVPGAICSGGGHGDAAPSRYADDEMGLQLLGEVAGNASTAAVLGARLLRR